MNLCGICKRPLDAPEDPLSVDCGGDCGGCIGVIEAEMGDPESMKKVAEEFAAGIRKWAPRNPRATDGTA